MIWPFKKRERAPEPNWVWLCTLTIPFKYFNSNEKYYEFVMLYEDPDLKVRKATYSNDNVKSYSIYFTFIKPWLTGATHRLLDGEMLTSRNVDYEHWKDKSKNDRMPKFQSEIDEEKKKKKEETKKQEYDGM